MTTRADLDVQQGKTFKHVFRWEEATLVYKPVTAITKSGPVSVTAEGHQVPNGWRAAIVSAGGMKEINAVNWPLRNSDLKKVTVVDPNTIIFNSVNSSDYKPYTAGGYLVYNKPVNLVGFTARATIKTKVGGEVLETLTTENGKILIDAGDSTVTLTISATATAEYSWNKGVYDLELVSDTGEVTAVASGEVSVTKEITD